VPQQAAEAAAFLEAYAPRLQYAFRSGLQIGHLAILEEVCAACRVLAAMPSGCALAESMLIDAATQAFAFAVGTCLSERLAPSEVFLPVAALERASAQVALDGEASPAEVPSVFHQRVEYLGLDLLRSLLAALLRAAASPAWLSKPATWFDGAGRAGPWAPWPGTPDSLTGRAHPAALGMISSEATNGGPQRLWAVVMDFVLEAARRVVEIMESLQGQRHAYLLVTAESGTAGGPECKGAFGLHATDGGPAAVASVWLPLSCALVPLGSALSGGGEQETCPSAASSFSSSSSGGLARGLTPPTTPRSPSGPVAASPPTFPTSPTDPWSRARKAKDVSRRSASYRHAGLSPHGSAGGQAAAGIVPECVPLADVRRLCGGILEMACTLLCHYCQLTKSNVHAGPERSMPGASVLHGLLSFLHELQTSASLGTLGIDAEYLLELDRVLRLGQGLGLPEGEQQQQQQQQHLNPAFDGDLWIPPAVSGMA